jgi:hypothetical protein
MESRFGTDFKDVRVHTDSQATASAEVLNANAYTSGRDIYFAAGKYAPENEEGKRLLAHELTHTIQQKNAVGVQAEALISRGGDPAEREADAMADTLVQYGKAVPVVQGQAVPVIQRAGHPAAAELASSWYGSDPETDTADTTPVVTVSKPPPRVPSRDRALALGTGAVLGGLLGNILFGPEALAEIEAAETIIELKGLEMFEPSERLGDYIKESGRGGVVFPARFSTIAAGNIIVRYENGAYQTDLHWLPMYHPDFQPRDNTRMVGLAVEFKDSKPSGWINVVTSSPGGKLVTDDRAKTGQDPELWSIMFGRSYHGPESVAFSSWENKLDRGELKLQTTLHLHPPDGPPMWGLFSLYNEHAEFAATAEVSGPGVETAMLAPIRREPKGLIAWRKPITLDQEWKKRGISGLVQASFVDGSFEARGRLAVAYPSSDPRLRGDINVVATSVERAWAIARSHDPAPQILPGLEPQSYSSGIALVGWGTLDLRITKGLDASAAFLVDPEGHLTARGILRALREELILIPAKPWKQKLFEPRWELLNVPAHWLVRGTVTAGVTVEAGATIGPVSLRDLVITGLYSTRPFTGSLLDISASLNASLEAWLEASAWLEGAVEVGIDLPQYCIGPLCTPDLDVDIVSVRAALTGKGYLRAYADARPRIVRFGAKDPSEEAMYGISGHLEVGGQFDVMLEPELSLGSVFGGPRFGFGGGKYPIAGGAVALDFEHVIGGISSNPTFKFNPVSFDPEKFVADLRQGDAPRDRPEKRKYTDVMTGKQFPAKDTPIPAHGPPPGPMTELHVPFEIYNRPHQLWLKLEKKPVLQVESPSRERLSEKLLIASYRVESAKALEVDPDRLTLLNQQHHDLAMLVAAAQGLEQEAEKLGQNPTNLWASELPALQDLATQLAEYGERYQDAELAGIAVLSTRPLEPTVVQPVDAPGASPPGIGRIGFHGSKPPSLRTGPEIWWLESEHIIPFATGKRLWDVLGLVVPGRGGHEDRGQTTIMIYEKAARFKTTADNRISEAFEAKVASIDAPERMQRARKHIESGNPEAARPEVHDVLNLMFMGLSAARQNAVERTNAAIVAESNMKMEGSPLTNAERRGPPGNPEDALPYPVQVDEAAARQYNDILDLATNELEAANILR